MESDTQKKICVCIMGMHRSGTSALAGSIARMGFDCGYSLLPKGEENQKGFYENAEILKINEELLNRAGYSWPDINSRRIESTLVEDFRKRIEDLIDDEFTSPNRIMIKDPRFSFTFPVWEIVLNEMGYDITVIVAIRNPSEIAGSLYRRNIIPHDQSYLLFCRYVLNALLVSNQCVTRVIDFNDLLKQKSDLLFESLDHLVYDELRTESVINRISRFLSSDLRHESSLGFLEEGSYESLAYNLHRAILDQVSKKSDDNKDIVNKFYPILDNLCQEYIEETNSSVRIEEAMLPLEQRIEELEEIIQEQEKNHLRTLNEESDIRERLLNNHEIQIEKARESIEKSERELCLWKDMSPFVSVIIICWNNSEFLRTCYDSILIQDYSNLEIILVDNDSIDNSVELTEELYPDVRILELEHNLGFAEGNNRAIELVLSEKKSDFIFILNPDTSMEPNCISELVLAAKKFYTFGSFSPKLLMMECPEYLNSAGGDCLFKCGDNLARSFFQLDNNDPNDSVNEIRDIFGPSGAATFIRTDLLRMIDGFEKELFTYYEDVELNFKVILAGWRSLYVPSSRVHHYQGGTLDDFSERKLYLLNRNKFVVLLRTLPYILWKRYFTEIFKSYLALMKHMMHINQTKIGIKLSLALILKLPYHLIKRRQLYNKLSPSIESKKYIGRLIEDHENAMTPQVRAQSFGAYNDYMAKRVG